MSNGNTSQSDKKSKSPQRWTDYDEYLTPEMLDGKSFTLTIAGYDDGEFYEQERHETVLKPILYFAETEKGLVLTRTNRRIVSHLFGNDKSACLGKTITLEINHVRAFGVTMPVIRIKDDPGE